MLAKCIRCGEEHEIKIDESKIPRLKDEHVQDVFPELNETERELVFISKICGTCWDEIFGEEGE